MPHPNKIADYMALAPNHATHAADLYLRLGMIEHHYNEPHRKYHNLGHIGFGYAQHAKFFGPMDASLFFAWTYHDVIYDPQASDNEERSARLFLKDNEIIGFSMGQADAIAMLILSTTHTGEKNTLTDIDLAGLGAPQEVYDANTTRIRQEYSFVDAPTWKAGRSAFIRRFLASDAIYQSPVVKAAYEVQARSNMERELAGL